MNNVKTVFLLVLLTGMLIGIGYLVAGPTGVPRYDKVWKR